MRKFAIPKSIYLVLVLLLGILSAGYTYAYFSSTQQAAAILELGKLDLVWRDKSINAIINNGDDSISVSAQELSAGEFSKIQASTQEQNSMRDLILELVNIDATVPIYCRIQINATYIPKGETDSFDCDEQWIQLAYDDGAGIPKLISDKGWFYDEGYYYYGDGSTKTLNTIEATKEVIVANYLYLSSNVDVDVYGGTISISLIAEAVQTTNNAYQSVWGVDW